MFWLFVVVILLLNALLIRGILFLILLCCPNLLLSSDIKLTKCIFLIIVDCDKLVYCCCALFCLFHFFLFGAHVRAVFLPLSPASTLVCNCFSHFALLLVFVCCFLSYFVLANKFDLIWLWLLLFWHPYTLLLFCNHIIILAIISHRRLRCRAT